MACTVACIGRPRGTDTGSFKSPRRRPRALAYHFRISLTTSAFLLAAFILFLLVGLSLPIIKSLYILHIQFAPNPNQPTTSVATELRFGVWGICAYSQFGSSECFGPMLGYTIPPAVLALTGFPSLVDGLATGVTVLLVLHLVAGALAFVGVFTSLFLESHAMCIVSLVTTVFTVILGLLVFAVDLALAILMRQRIGPLTEFNYTANWGPAVWMVLAAVILSIVGMILMGVVVCECCCVGRRAHHRHHHPGGQEKT